MNKTIYWCCCTNTKYNTKAVPIVVWCILLFINQRYVCRSSLLKRLMCFFCYQGKARPLVVELKQTNRSTLHTVERKLTENFSENRNKSDTSGLLI